MKFELSPEQCLFEETIGAYLRAECPVAGTLARAEAARPDASWDAGAWKGLAALGLAGVAVPAEYGGLGLGVLDLAVAAQALGHGAAPGPWLAHWLAELALLRAGSDEQQSRWLPGLADGSVRATLLWNARGTPALGARSADVAVVRDGDSLGLIAADGIGAEPLPGADYTRPIDTVELVRPPDPLPTAGADTVTWLRAAGHTLVAADCFGGSLRALEESVAYAKTRRQFGQLIGGFQAVKHQIANLALLVEPGRGLYWFAAYAIDESLPDAAGAAALAKAHLSEGYVQAVRDAIELHGGFGYTWECDLHVYLKRALLNREFLGDPETLRQELARAEFGPAGEPKVCAR